MKTFVIENPKNANPPESKVWFHVTATDGRVTALEEHDGYAGGAIGQDGEDLALLFLKRVAAKGGDIAAAHAFIDDLTAVTVEQIKPHVWYGGANMPRVMAFIWEDGPDRVNYVIEGLTTMEALWTDKQSFTRMANGDSGTRDVFQNASQIAVPAGTVINPEAQTDEQKAFFEALAKMI